MTGMGESLTKLPLILSPSEDQEPHKLCRCQFLNRQFRHACAPVWVSQFQFVAAGVKEVEFPTREEPLGTVNQTINRHLAFQEQFAGLNQSLVADCE